MKILLVLSFIFVNPCVSSAPGNGLGFFGRLTSNTSSDDAKHDSDNKDGLDDDEHLQRGRGFFGRGRKEEVEEDDGEVDDTDQVPSPVPAKLFGIFPVKEKDVDDDASDTTDTDTDESSTEQDSPSSLQKKIPVEESNSDANDEEENDATNSSDETENRGFFSFLSRTPEVENYEEEDPMRKDEEDGNEVEINGDELDTASGIDNEVDEENDSEDDVVDDADIDLSEENSTSEDKEKLLEEIKEAKDDLLKMEDEHLEAEEENENLDEEITQVDIENLLEQVDKAKDENNTDNAKNETEIPPNNGQRGNMIIIDPMQRQQFDGGMARFPFHQQFQQQQQMQPGMKSMMTGYAMTEAAAAFVAAAVRICLITYLARLFRNQEESIQTTQHYAFENLNQKFDRDSKALQNILSESPDGLSNFQWRWRKNRMEGRRPKVIPASYQRTVVVIELDSNGYMHNDGSGVDLSHFPDVVTFLLQQYNSNAFGMARPILRGAKPQPLPVEFVLLVTCPGGSVTQFGLAASQMQRIRNVPGITTTVCVDQIAASGGYMIASQANKIISAPFAVVGSIGVIYEVLNYRELAQKIGIEPLTLKAGSKKNPISEFGKVSNADIASEEKHMAKIHEAFQDLVASGRPELMEDDHKFKTVTDGSVYFGGEAVDLGLVDFLMTSDEYISKCVSDGDRVIRIHRSYQRKYLRNLRWFDLLPSLIDGVNSRTTRLLRHLSKGKISSINTSIIPNMVRASGWIGFTHHLLSKYGGKRT